VNAYGMPGPGGSLGECALCGKPFIAEILLGKRVKSFTTDGCNQTLYGHDDCMKKYEGVDLLDLPPESALRKAFEKSRAPKEPT